MEFLGVGLPELLVILLITLIVVGPQRLPEMAAQIARAMREFRRYTSNLSREVTEALEDLEKEYNTVREEWKEVSEAVRHDVKAVEAEVSGAVEDARAGLSVEERAAGGQTSPQATSSKVISMEDAARRSGRPPEGSPDPPSTDAADGDQRPAGQSHS
jgi:Tat protein translocase TatB subunit